MYQYVGVSSLGVTALHVTCDVGDVVVEKMAADAASICCAKIKMHLDCISKCAMTLVLQESGSIVHLQVMRTVFYDATSDEAPLVSICVPENLKLHLSLKNGATCSSIAKLSNVFGTLYDTSSCIFAACVDVNLKLFGKARLRCRHAAGALSITCRDRAQAKINGEYTSVVLACAGSATVRTYDTCKGTYVALACESSSIFHDGAILDVVRATTSGEAVVCTRGVCEGTYVANASDASCISHIGAVQGVMWKTKTEHALICADPPTGCKRFADRVGYEPEAKRAKKSTPPVQLMDIQQAFVAIELYPTVNWAEITNAFLRKFLALVLKKGDPQSTLELSKLEMAYETLQVSHGPK